MNSNLEKIRELQILQIEMIKLFVSICEKEKLTYYMSAGTMLGAVRHGGYIPWDDDADFMMPRADYNRFLEVCNKYMHSPFSVRHYTDSNRLPYYIIRIVSSEKMVDVATAMIPRIEEIWIDIFPIDGMPTKRFFQKIHQGKLLFVRALFMLSIFKEWVRVDKPHRPWYERAMISFAKHFPIQNMLSYPKLWHALDKALQKYPCEQSDIWVNFTGGYKFKEMFPQKVFGHGRLYDFEGLKLVGVDDYHTYLSSLYGDYMTPPPEEERMGHTTSINQRTPPSNHVRGGVILPYVNKQALAYVSTIEKKVAA